MNRNNFFLLNLLFARGKCLAVGGQAVLEGVMIRNGDYYGFAVRKPDGSVYAACVPWQQIFPLSWNNLPFFRGFPILLESLVNGIKGLLLSASIQEENSPKKTGVFQIAISIIMAIVIAIFLFILLPHFLSLLMHASGVGSDVEKLTFHIWDGFFKCAIFIFYILAISLVPEIRRLFENHGAEHKVVQAYENGYGLNFHTAGRMNRLHPRCGTTFLLFVICISIIVQAIIVPLLLLIWVPDSWLFKQAWSVFLKLLLIIPVSGITFEIIRFAANLPDGIFSKLLLAPGLGLQRLTTREPSLEQLEIATLALACALRQPNHPI